MSKRLDRSWLVIESYESSDFRHCVDLFRRPDGTFGFEEFRRDPEDRGEWTPLSYHSAMSYPSDSDALTAACRLVSWFDES
jgi:hypothetical protein